MAAARGPPTDAHSAASRASGGDADDVAVSRLSTSPSSERVSRTSAPSALPEHAPPGGQLAAHPSPVTCNPPAMSDCVVRVACWKSCVREITAPKTSPPPARITRAPLHKRLRGPATPGAFSAVPRVVATRMSHSNLRQLAPINYFCTLLFAFALFFDVTLANWWQLGMPTSQHSAIELTPTAYKDNCHRLEYLVERQRELCSVSDKILAIVGSAAKLGIDECQYQFRHSRWNCSTFDGNDTVFGGVLSVKSRETAYIYAVSAASVAFAVTRACSRGELNDCNCDIRGRHHKRNKQPPRNWKWGGCSEDIHYGEDFSRNFVDSREKSDTAAGLMNLHNNEAGRRTIRSRMQRVCKCHGMSGSCSLRVCWRKMPTFRVVSEALAARYEGASHVKLVERKGRLKKLRAISRDLKKPNKTDLVYLDDSPDYCERNETLGIPGTKGRLCNRTSPGLDGCRLLCCGRGYQTRVRDVEEKCRCRFVWCCNVVCDMCQYRKEEHVCN